MKERRVVFAEPHLVELQTFEFDPDDLGPRDVAMRTTHSLISPGTELACLRGTESWARLPFVPGYGGCGEVVAVGEAAEGIRVGDRVFSYTKHASAVKSGVLVAPVPDGLETKRAVFARMAAVSMTALRVSEAELGDFVAVYGLGLVGNLCAQLFALAGCQVIGIDLLQERCETARICGVHHTINSTRNDVKAFVQDVTHGEMCATVVEAIGASPVAAQAAELAGKLGEVILLGSPRAEHTTDITPHLNQIHLWGNGCITFKGAHEWRYPRHRDPNGQVKHSIARNVDILLGLIADGRLQIDPLITHVLPPERCAEAYAGLRDQKDEYMGVVFEW